jgi:hypothetical protein
MLLQGGKTGTDLPCEAWRFWFRVYLVSTHGTYAQCLCGASFASPCERNQLTRNRCSHEPYPMPMTCMPKALFSELLSWGIGKIAAWPTRVQPPGGLRSVGLPPRQAPRGPWLLIYNAGQLVAGVLPMCFSSTYTSLCYS